MRFTAPTNVSGIGFKSGRFIACDADGTVTTPADLTELEAADLIEQGFTPAPDTTAAPAPAPKIKPADPAA